MNEKKKISKNAAAMIIVIAVMLILNAVSWLSTGITDFYRDAVNYYLGHKICGYEGRYLGNCNVKITAESRKQQRRKIIHRRLGYIARIACGKGVLKGKLLHKYYSSFKEIACFHVRRMESIGKGKFLKGSAHKIDVLRA